MIKIDRSFPEPISLAEEKRKNGTYSTEEVNRRLKEDFHNKCYICELGNLQDPEIEHLLPHKNGKFPERKFDWENLFWACGRCNGIKAATMYDDGILDCCKQDPEDFFVQWYENDQVQISIRKNGDDPVIQRTHHLLNEVYNKTNTGMRIITSQQRIDELCGEMSAFLKSLEEYINDRESKRQQRTIRAFLSRRSPFAAFKREYIRSHQHEYPELFDFICL